MLAHRHRWLDHTIRRGEKNLVSRTILELSNGGWTWEILKLTLRLGCEACGAARNLVGNRFAWKTANT